MNRNGPSHAHGEPSRVKAQPSAALGLRLGPERRTVEAARIIDELLALGWADVVAAGHRDAAEQAARQTLERLVGLGLGFEPLPGGDRGFDPAEVNNFVQWASLEHGDTFWSDLCVPSGRRLVWAAHGLTPVAGAVPPPPMALGPRRFRVRLRRSFNLNTFAPGQAIRLRLPLPIVGAALSDLEIQILPCTDAKVRFATAEARLDARLTVPAGQSIELGFEAAFTAHAYGGAGDSAPLTAGELALYTHPNEGLIKVSGAIRRLASALAGAETDAWAQVRRFWDFLNRLRVGVVNYDEIDLARPNDWTAEREWTDCQLAAALMASLCRARGIPARLVSGYVLDEHTPYHHYWAEAWIAGRGWTPFDALSLHFSAGGREPGWRDYYFGQVDYRMKTECLPRLFNGAGAVRLPARWYRLSKVTDGGLECAFYDRDGGALVYRDHVAVLDAAPA